LNEIVELTTVVVCKELLELQLGAGLELFHALGGLNKMAGSLFATDVADGTNPCVADGYAAAVVPYAFMHDTTLSTPSLKHTVPIAGKKRCSERQQF
jgi:hypothetical protein